MLHEQSAPAVTSAPTTFITRHFPTSVLLQEQREEFKPLLHLYKEEKTSQVRALHCITCGILNFGKYYSNFFPPSFQIMHIEDTIFIFEMPP